MGICNTNRNCRKIIIGEGGKMAQENSQQQNNELKDHEIVTFSRLALSLANDYESIYYINAKDDSYVEYGADEYDKSLTVLSLGDDFFTDVTYNVPRLVYKDDQKAFLNAFVKKNMIENLRGGKSFMLDYRLVKEGRAVYYQLKAIRGSGADNDFIIVGVKNVDEQVRREMIAAAETRIYGEISMALSSRYEVIYYIDTESNIFTQYSSSDEYAKLGVSKKGNDFFATATADMDKYIDPDDRERMKKALEKENLLDALSQTGAVSFTYKQLLDGRPQYVTMTVVRPVNDTNRIVIGIMNVDRHVRREQAARAASQTYSQIIRALAKLYEVIYYVDLETDHYQEYSASDKYAKLEVGASGEDFFGETQRNMKRDIYPEDYPIMAKAMDKQQFISDLEQTGTTSITYRLMLDGRPQYVTLFALRPEDDRRHVIVAVSNIDAAKQREMEFRAELGAAIDLANKDALTKVKNKLAYNTATKELDDRAAADPKTEYAVVVMDINGLKYVNDTQGHNSGDEYIKQCCHIICTVFQHSPVFRIGGDEFAVLLTGDDYKNREDLLVKFRKIITENSKKGLANLASGMATFDVGLDRNVEAVFERADKAMYENKRLFKGRYER